MKGASIGGPHYYPDTGRIVCVDKRVRGVIKKDWIELTGFNTGFSTVRVEDDGDVGTLILDACRLSGIDLGSSYSYRLVFWMDGDEIVHIGSVTVIRDGDGYKITFEG